MTDPEVLSRYNYDSFVPESFEPWMRFDESPQLQGSAPDFPLWNLDGRETKLSSLWKERDFLIVEFGSFT